MAEESIFAAALAIPSPAARAAYLERACADNLPLRREIEGLLAAHAASNLLDRAPADLARTGAYNPESTNDVALAAVGDRVGPYKLLEKIGEGGMGEVWVADQLEPIKRRVALKLIKPGMDSRSVLGRFEAERQALAVMDHPNIAKVLDAGTTTDGRPYFVMELVKGTPITEFCDARKLTPKQRLELFVPVCNAIQHAHMKGIIHRDIKPSNVLVALHDETPVPKVIDFGVAKAVGQQLTEKTIYTGFGALVGTPAYMAPEQATFNQLDVDTRADVYALGVLLYELLAGSPPIEAERLKRSALDEILRIVRDEEPPRPSARLSTSQAKASIAATRGSDPTKLSALMKGEIDWIVMKALEKDRTRRYDTANGLAKDVQRYLAGDAVEACPPTLGYRMQKAYRRNRAAVRVASAFVCLCLGAVAMGVYLAVRATNAERAAEERRDEAVKAQLAEAERADGERKAKDAAVAERKRADEEAAIAKAMNVFFNNDLLMKGNPDVQAGDGHPFDKNITLKTVVDRAAAKIDTKFADQPLVAAALHNSVFKVFSSLDDPTTALRHAERSWELNRSVRGDDHRETLRAVNGIGSCLVNRGDYEKAEPWFKGNYERAKRLFGEEDADTLNYLNNVAFIYEVRKLWADAVPLRKLHNDLTLRAYGEADVRSLGALQAKARELAAARKRDESEEVTRRAYELARDKLPTYDRQTVWATQNWVQVLVRRGKTAEAEALAIATHENCMKQFKTVGTGSTLVSGEFLINTYLALGKPEAAEPLALELVTYQRATTNDDPAHPVLCEARALLIRVYQRQQKWALAEPLLIEQSKYGRVGGERENAEIMLITAYSLQEKHAVAETLIRERVVLAKASAGAESKEYGFALILLVPNQIAQQKWAESEELARECLVILEKSQPPQQQTSNIQSLLGVALLKQKKYADAEPLLLKGYERVKKLSEETKKQFESMNRPLPPWIHQQVSDALDRLIELYTATKKPDEAKKWWAERVKYPPEVASPPRAVK